MKTPERLVVDARLERVPTRPLLAPERTAGKLMRGARNALGV
jgi:hypothetical protein